MIFGFKLIPKQAWTAINNTITTYDMRAISSEPGAGHMSDSFRLLLEGWGSGRRHVITPAHTRNARSEYNRDLAHSSYAITLPDASVV